MSDKIEEEVLELIRRSNFKQCYDYVGKLRKQYPNSAFLLALELYVKYRHTPQKFDRTLLDTIQTSETHAISFLYKFYVELLCYDKALGVYEIAATKYPSYETSYMWFSKAVEVNDYKAMARASLQMAKYNSNSNDTKLECRDYLIWHAISVVALFRWKRSSVSETESKVLPQLCYKNMLSLKPFKSVQELIIFCEVCETLFDNKSKEIVDQILPKLDYTADLYLKNFFVRNIDSLEPQERYNSCIKILANYDDFSVIECLLRAGMDLNIDKNTVLDKLKSMIGDSRNFRVANLKADVIFNGRVQEHALKFYIDKFYNKPCCHIDLNNYSDFIDFKQLRQFFMDIDSEDLLYEYNKLMLFKDCSVEQSISIFKKHQNEIIVKSKTNISKNSEFIMNIIRANVIEKKEMEISDVLFGITILENYQSQDLYNFETRLWLVVFYLYLGIVPLAYSHFKELNVKNVQVDSVEYVMYSRFSTMFPNKQHDYLKNIFDCPTNIYENSLKRLPALLRVSFERKAYSKILGMIEFYRKLEVSTNRWMRSIEKSKLTRLNNEKRNSGMTELLVLWESLQHINEPGLSDNRDKSLFHPYLDLRSCPAVLQQLHIDETWLYANISQEFMIEAVSSRATEPIVKEMLSNYDIIEKVSASETMTVTERQSFELIHDVYANDGSNVLSILDKIDLAETKSIGWLQIHSYLQQLTVLKTLDNMKKLKDKVVKQQIKSKLSYVRGNCDEIFDVMIRDIKKGAGQLKSGGYKDIVDSLGFNDLDEKILVDSINTVRKVTRNL